MKYLNVVFCLIWINGFGQKDTVFIRKNTNPFSEKVEYRTDTIVFDTPNARNILIGNSKLPQTPNQQLTKQFGLFFKSFEVKDCEESGKPTSNTILNVEKSQEECQIKVLVYTNCCQDFLADINVENNNTLNLIFYNYGMYCSCSCSFELTYTLRVIDFEDLKKIKYLTINGKTKTRLK